MAGLLNLLDVELAREGDVVQVVKASAVKAAHDVHDVIKNDGLVEGALLGSHASRVHLGPLAGFHLVLE